MTPTIEPKVAVEPANWKEFLQEFSLRNYNRRARFDIFRINGKVQEEGREAHLEDVSLKMDGDTRNIEVIRIDRSNANADKIKDTIASVVGVAVQYDTDRSEDALEITDNENSLISLRLESKVDVPNLGHKLLLIAEHTCVVVPKSCKPVRQFSFARGVLLQCPQWEDSMMCIAWLRVDTRAYLMRCLLHSADAGICRAHGEVSRSTENGVTK